MIAANVREGDVIRLTPGGPACRVYRDRRRSRNVVDCVLDDGAAMARFTTGAGVVTVPASLEVEVVARHGTSRPVSLTKAWYLGPPGVGSVVTYRHTPAAPGAGVFRVVDIEDGRYHLEPFTGGRVVHTDARVGDLTLVRSHAVESVRRVRAAKRAGDAA